MSHIWPIGIVRIGSKIYFFFMAVNLVCVPVIWLLYPETKGRSLEDMDVLFGGSPRTSSEGQSLLAPPSSDGRDSPSPKDPDPRLERDVEHVD